MFVERYYHKRKKLAFVILPGIEDVDTLAMELKLLKEHLGIHPPTIFEIRKIAEGPMWGHSMIKFPLHPVIPFEQDWPDMTKEVADKMRIEPYKIPE